MMQKILVVDDEELIIDLFLNRFSEEYKIHTAFNGAEAVRICSLENFDLVIMDIVMPELDGIEAAKAIKICQPDIKIIIMSGHYNSDQKERLNLIKFDLFIEKPFIISDMAKDIKKIIG